MDLILVQFTYIAGFDLLVCPVYSASPLAVFDTVK